jgi:hypothetical protein
MIMVGNAATIQNVPAKDDLIGFEIHCKREHRIDGFDVM